jgi:hypothetical protein
MPEGAASALDQPRPAAASAPAPDPRLEDPRFAIPPHTGEHYYQVLARLHRLLRPETYLEIGIRDGRSLALAHCASIGIDPAFQLVPTAVANKPSCHLYRMGSDAFFARHDPKAVLGAPIDIAFLDGMHLFEFLLRDFIQAERHCRPNSVVVLHDCLPTDIGMARRERGAPTGPEGLPTRSATAWTGDVWRILPILRARRPELRILALDAAPTGLVLVTGLDPASRVLEERYFDIVEEGHALDLGAIGLGAFVEAQQVRPTRSLTTETDLARHFWL